MNYRRAVVISIVTYLATMVVGLILSLGFGITLDITTRPTPTVLIVSMVLATVFTALGGIWYFSSPHTISGAQQGFFFGIIATIVGFFMDGILFLLLFVSGGNPFQFFHDAYNFWFFGFMIVIVFIATTITGKMKLIK